MLTLNSSTLTSSIITLVVGRDQRLFAAHEDVLCHSPFFQAACRGQFMEATNKRISLPDEEPEIFSSVLEYLYKGDYYPRLVHNKRRNAWELEMGEGGAGSVESTVYHHGVDGELLKDTVIYCTAEKYGLDELKRVALRKQGLRKLNILVQVIVQTN
jgi:BTB/POZ domain